MNRKKKIEGESSLHLTDKKHPKQGIASTLLGICSLGGFSTICVVASQSRGNAGLFIGFVGVAMFVISVIGFILSWISLRQEDIRTLFPTIGAIVNGILTVFYLFLYIWGTTV